MSEEIEISGELHHWVEPAHQNWNRFGIAIEVDSGYDGAKVDQFFNECVRRGARVRLVVELPEGEGQGGDRGK